MRRTWLPRACAITKAAVILASKSYHWGITGDLGTISARHRQAQTLETDRVLDSFLRTGYTAALFEARALGVAWEKVGLRKRRGKQLTGNARAVNFISRGPPAHVELTAFLHNDQVPNRRLGGECVAFAIPSGNSQMYRGRIDPESRHMNIVSANSDSEFVGFVLCWRTRTSPFPSHADKWLGETRDSELADTTSYVRSSVRTLLMGLVWCHNRHSSE